MINRFRKYVWVVHWKCDDSVAAVFHNALEAYHLVEEEPQELYYYGKYISTDLTGNHHRAEQPKKRGSHADPQTTQGDNQ